MRSIWHVFLFAVFLNLILAMGFLAWLWTSGRMSKDRLIAVYELFEPTLADAQAEAERVAQELAAEQARQQAAARLEAAKEGPLSLSDRMTSLREADERTLLKLDRLDRVQEDIRGQIQRAQAALAEQSEQLERDRAALNEYIEQRNAQLNAEDFRQAVALLSAQKPRQAKAMLQAILDDGDQETVVDYLAAMQTRIAAKVLAEFKEPAEVEQATRLIEALRARGVFTLSKPAEETDA